MSTLTTNYELIKPELTDAADITAMNDNWDKIDSKLREINNKVNLLDNSDFRLSQLVNQRGFAGGAPSDDNVYFIDRWKTQQNTTKNIEIRLLETGLFITVPKGLAGIAQKIINPKTDVTFAAKINGEIAVVHAKYGEDNSVKTDDNVLLYVEWLENELQVIIRNTGEEANQYTVEWAALYEGEYTAKSLPEYQPKGYSAELVECQRYYYQSWNATIAADGVVVSPAIYTNRLQGVQFPVTMRATPTITIYNTNKTVGAVKEWVTSEEVTGIKPFYSSNKRFTLGTDGHTLTTSKYYGFHYSASADL